LTAPLDVILSQFDVVQPDIVALVKDRVGIFGAKGIGGRPDAKIPLARIWPPPRSL